MTVGGKTLYMRDEHIRDPGTPDEQGGCALSLVNPFLFNDGEPDGPHMLGEPSFPSFVTVYDIGASEIRFSERR
jgi:hypothetical protein